MAAPGETYQLAFPPKTKPHISTGLPFPEACAHHVTNTYHASKVYIIVSSSISKTENFTNLQKALSDKIVGIRRGIKPHTPWDDILEIVTDIQKKEADIIVTLGAGSLTDGAKVVSLVSTSISEEVKVIDIVKALANNVSELDDLEKLTAEAKTKDLRTPSVPVINIPTSLSGGEYSPFAGATDKRTDQKRSFAHPDMGADLIILDPVLSVSTPERIWLSTGIRAVDHCVEGLCSTNPKVCEESDRGFTEGLKLLVPNLLLTRKDWTGHESRLKEMMGVVEAMKALGLGIPMGGSHGIGHQLGPLGVGHGETSCILLPAVLKYNYLHGDEKVKQLQQKVLDIFWNEDAIEELLKSNGLRKDVADAGDVVGAVISGLGMPRSLKDVGVGREKLDGLANNSMKDR
jgi:alcohol dehydrogenase class IV